MSWQDLSTCHSLIASLKKKKLKKNKLDESREGATTSCSKFSKFPSPAKQGTKDCNADRAAQPCVGEVGAISNIWSQHPSWLLVTCSDIRTKIFNKHITYQSKTANLSVRSGNIPSATWSYQLQIYMLQFLVYTWLTSQRWGSPWQPMTAGGCAVSPKHMQLL